MPAASPSPTLRTAPSISTLADPHNEKYPGGKGGEGHWQWIIDQMPSHSTYVEGCVGKGKVLREKPPALRTVAIDTNRDVIRWWRRRRWPGVELVHGCAIDWLIAHADELDDDALLYLDPPYWLAARTKKRIYGRHEWTDRQHRVMLGLVLSLGCRVMISGYRTVDYDDALSRWTRLDRWCMTRGGPRLESLWLNFDPEQLASPHRPLPGRDFRERERIKRKLARHVTNFRALPRYERQALLLALIEEERKLR